MLTIGLTGSTGSGKGYVSDIFKAAGIPCLDTDQVCRDVYRKGEACYEDLVTYFGQEILSEDGEIDRRVLFHLTFPDKEKYQALNSIAFLHIMKVTRRWLADCEEAGTSLVVVDAPMLFESGFDKLCQRSVCVIADKETQIRRVMARDGISEEEALSRLSRQKSNDYYRSRCDYELNNSASHEETIKTDTIDLIARLRQLADEMAK